MSIVMTIMQVSFADILLTVSNVSNDEDNDKHTFDSGTSVLFFMR